ncbi:MAG: preprotein translocase subunit SecY [Anaerolineae bacterium]
MIQAVKNALSLPDLRRKIFFTFFILFVYRAASHVPVPGVDQQALQSFMVGGQAGSQLIGFLDLLSGGALSNFSVMAMGVYPYITASIILQLLQPIIPQLEEIAREPGGRERLNQYTHWLTVPLAALQAYGQAIFIQRSVGANVLTNFGFNVDPLGTIATIATMTAGTVFAVWLGELITEQGIGNGVSLIIFGGIVARLPQNVLRFVVSRNYVNLVIFALITAATVGVIVFVQEGQRRIPVQYGKRVRGTRVYGGQSAHIPLRVNSAGMIPLIFAQSLMIFPSTIASYFYNPNNTGIFQGLVNGIYENLRPANDAWMYWIMYFLMVIGFTYFYTDVIFRQQNLAESLQRQGGFIPGLRPGKRTEEYLNRVLQRITLVGAIFLGGVAILPWLAQQIPGVQTTAGQTQSLLITSTGLLIVVGVVLDTLKQLEAQLLMRHYEGFIK